MPRRLMRLVARAHPGCRRGLRRPMSVADLLATDPILLATERRMQRDGTGREGVGNDPTDQARALSLPSLGSHPKIKDVIYQELRERIAFGDFEPGDRLVEADLAMRFGVSKTPVAGALDAGGRRTGGAAAPPRRRGLAADGRGVVRSDLLARRWRSGARRDHGEDDRGGLRRAEAALIRWPTPGPSTTIAATPGSTAAPRDHPRRGRPCFVEGDGAPAERPAGSVRLLVTRDQARWADDLEMNRRRIELIRQRDAKAYARMVKDAAESTRMVARLTGPAGRSGGQGRCARRRSAADTRCARPARLGLCRHLTDLTTAFCACVLRLAFKDGLPMVDSPTRADVMRLVLDFMQMEEFAKDPFVISEADGIRAQVYGRASTSTGWPGCSPSAWGTATARSSTR